MPVLTPICISYIISIDHFFIVILYYNVSLDISFTVLRECKNRTAASHI